MEPTSPARDRVMPEPLAPHALEIVSGGAGEPEPLVRGVRAVRDLLDAPDAVLFALAPEGAAFHAAAGTDSARLAQGLAHHVREIEACVQGPCVFAPPGVVRGDADGPVVHASPAAGLVLLAERVHRRLAYGLAVAPRCPTMPVEQVGLAHALFRDLVRLLRARDLDRRPAPAADARWQNRRFAGLVGTSRSMRRLFEIVAKLSRSDVNVLLLGESGTGKELVARAIHDCGLYAGRRFVAQNCAALPEALLESELFGHCKGAFTGAHFEKRGLFEEANGGTFFLDEIADMPIPLQIKLLRVLQEGEIRRLGETRTRQVSVRIVAATNKNLAEEVARGRFRADLYYRLNVVQLELPPLRRRREDVPLLARYFSDTICARLGRPALRFAPEVETRLVEHAWPGNVRELENEIERLVALHGEDETVRPYMLSERLRYGCDTDFAFERLEEFRELHGAIEHLERVLIARALDRNIWNKSRAAQELGISRQGLIKKIVRLGLQRPSPGSRARAAIPPREPGYGDGDATAVAEPVGDCA